MDVFISYVRLFLLTMPTTTSRKRDSIRSEIQNLLNKYNYIFEEFTHIKVLPPVEGKNKTVFSFVLPSEGDFYILKDYFGRVQFRFMFEEEDSDVELVEFSFKFVSDNVKIIVEDEGTKLNPQKYGFRIDRDTAIVDNAHPGTHLQHNYLRRPRIDLSNMSTTDELGVFSAFLNTIDTNFFEEKVRCHDSHGVIKMSDLR